MRWIKEEILKKPRRIWGLFAVAAAFSSISLIVRPAQFVEPRPVKNSQNNSGEQDSQVLDLTSQQATAVGKRGTCAAVLPTDLG
jgi:hypothetical protein